MKKFLMFVLLFGIFVGVASFFAFDEVVITNKCILGYRNYEYIPSDKEIENFNNFLSKFEEEKGKMFLPNSVFNVVGHASSNGNRFQNNLLSEKRASWASNHVKNKTRIEPSSESKGDSVNEKKTEVGYEIRGKILNKKKIPGLITKTSVIVFLLLAAYYLWFGYRLKKTKQEIEKRKEEALPNSPLELLDFILNNDGEERRCPSCGDPVKNAHRHTRKCQCSIFFENENIRDKFDVIEALKVAHENGETEIFLRKQDALLRRLKEQSMDNSTP